MSALANHAFAKMNGIGNEIVVVDMRDSAAKVTPDDARAVASANGGVAYDQLMVLSKPRLDGAAAFISIYNNAGSPAGPGPADRRPAPRRSPRPAASGPSAMSRSRCPAASSASNGASATTTC